jgi:hypothetical protein
LRNKIYTSDDDEWYEGIDIDVLEDMQSKGFDFKNFDKEKFRDAYGAALIEKNMPDMLEEINKFTDKLRQNGDKNCAQCGCTGRLYTCSRCRTTKYCGVKCQAKDKHKHKEYCIEYFE